MQAKGERTRESHRLTRANGRSSRQDKPRGTGRIVGTIGDGNSTLQGS
jgi:hypothetical protein